MSSTVNSMKHLKKSNSNLIQTLSSMDGGNIPLTFNKNKEKEKENYKTNLTHG